MHVILILPCGDFKDIDCSCREPPIGGDFSVFIDDTVCMVHISIQKWSSSVYRLNEIYVNLVYAT